MQMRYSKDDDEDGGGDDGGNGGNGSDAGGDDGGADGRKMVGVGVMVCRAPGLGAFLGLHLLLELKFYTVLVSLLLN